MQERDDQRAGEAGLTSADDKEPEIEYSRLADLAERIATDIAVADPDWCSLAKDAAELAEGTRLRCCSGT